MELLTLFFFFGVLLTNPTIFVIDEYEIKSNSTNVIDISLDWNSENLPNGSITLNQLINGTIELQIPKSMPRTMNLDFGSSIVLMESDDYLYGNISETESDCSYILLITFKNNDHIIFGSASAATGNWEPVSILNQACGDFSLKQQLENNMVPNEIECKNENHILIERSNGKLACVLFETAEKLNWNKID